MLHYTSIATIKLPYSHYSNSLSQKHFYNASHTQHMSSEVNAVKTCLSISCVYHIVMAEPIIRQSTLDRMLGTQEFHETFRVRKPMRQIH